MPLTPSTKLGAYKILESIGAGGMGEGQDVELERGADANPEAIMTFQCHTKLAEEQ